MVAERGEGGWSSSPEAIEPEKIARLVEELSSLVADGILADRVGPEELANLGLAPARTTFLVEGAEDARLAEIRLGRIRPGAGVVAQTGENPQIFELSTDLGEFVPLNAEGLRNHFLAPPPEPESAPMSEGEPALGTDLELDAGEQPSGLDAGALEDLEALER